MRHWEHKKSLLIPAVIAIALLIPKSVFLTDLYGQNQQASQELKDLVTKLQKGDVEERQRAAIALGMEKNPNAVEALIKALDDKDDFVRDFAVKALGNIGDSKALEPLVKALNNDENMLVRRSAATALGNLRDAAALEPLLQALNKAHFMVRRAAARALGKLNDPKAIDPLIGVLGDSDVYIQNSAVSALIEIAQPAVPKLLDVLGNWSIGPLVAEILENLGWQPSSDQEKIRFDVAKRNKQALLDNWATAEKVLWTDAKSENSLLAQNAVSALIGIGRDETVEELIRILAEKGDAEMAQAFMHCGNASLLKAAQDWAEKHGKEEIVKDNERDFVEWGGMSPSQIAANITGIM
jgi:HEAT repeat protein